MIILIWILVGYLTLGVITVCLALYSDTQLEDRDVMTSDIGEYFLGFLLGPVAFFLVLNNMSKFFRRRVLVRSKSHKARDRRVREEEKKSI